MEKKDFYYPRFWVCKCTLKTAMSAIFATFVEHMLLLWHKYTPTTNATLATDATRATFFYQHKDRELASSFYLWRSCVVWRLTFVHMINNFFAEVKTSSTQARIRYTKSDTFPDDSISSCSRCLATMPRIHATLALRHPASAKTLEICWGDDGGCSLSTRKFQTSDRV